MAEEVNVTVEFPSQELVASVLVNEYVDTVIVFVLLLLKLLLQPDFERFLTVIIELPSTVNPVAVNVPDPAVVTTIEAVLPVVAGELMSYVTVYVPVGSCTADEVSDTVDDSLQVFVASVPVRLKVVTVIVLVLLLLISLLHPDLARFVTVIVELPAVVNPVAVNVPVPAVVIVIVAVSPVAAGELRLYVTVYVPVGSFDVVVLVSVTVDDSLHVLAALVPVKV